MPSTSNKLRARRSEAVGILIVAILILSIILVRFGRHIAWSAR